ncbi:MAG TPA: class IV adenylate cyclase [Candidatus Paceibacterota bacterium]|nr:class IV adenylate cyclase [Candidatus Paceibacterota bacterium]
MEIEVKAKLKDKAEVIKKLSGLGCQFSEIKTQDDMVWVEKVGSLEDFLSNKVFLRIRIQNGEKVIMTAKSPKAKEGNESLVKREHEVVVNSADEARSILSMLGLQEAVRVVKKRQTAKYAGYEICIDEIEDLGSFVELEKIAEEGDATQIQKQMIEFLKTLGILPEDQVKKGYDILMLERK